MIQNKAFIYKGVPEAFPIAGRHLAIEDIGFDECAPPPENGFTSQNLYASFDPSQRSSMRDPEIQSFSTALEIGKPVVSHNIIGKVLKSANSKFKEGTIVLLESLGTESFSIVLENSAERARVLQPQEGIPLTAYLGALGWTGLTAYGSLHEIGCPKKGDVILVSTAAGAVGQAVGQIAIRGGFHVIGSVGSDQKLNFIVDELGFASGFNYKKGNLTEVIKRLAPNGLDIYYDNVGGELLDAALQNMKVGGRIVASGMVSTYNGTSYHIKNLPQIHRRRIKWEGFVVTDPNITKWAKERDENITKWIQDGTFKSTDHITEGMDAAVEGFLGMLRGENNGKSILRIV